MEKPLNGCPYDRTENGKILDKYNVPCIDCGQCVYFLRGYHAFEKEVSACTTMK